jgi:hypothetical protein
MAKSDGKSKRLTAITPDGKTCVERTTFRDYTKAVCIISSHAVDYKTGRRTGERNNDQRIVSFSGAEKPNLSQWSECEIVFVPIFIIVRWYDRETKSWVVQLKDLDENQIGDAVYVGSKAEAKKINQKDWN